MDNVNLMMFMPNGVCITNVSWHLNTSHAFIMYVCIHYGCCYSWQLVCGELCASERARDAVATQFLRSSHNISQTMSDMYLFLQIPWKRTWVMISRFYLQVVIHENRHNYHGNDTVGCSFSIVRYHSFWIDNLAAGPRQRHWDMTTERFPIGLDSL